MKLEDAYKGYTLDQDKLFSPEETVRRFKERLKHLYMDIFDGTLRIDTGRLGIPVYFSLCGSDGEEIIGAKKLMGKGGTPPQAEASAVMELTERFSFFSFYQNPDNFLVEEYRHLGDRALPFDAIARSVHDDSGDLERAREIFSRIPLKWARGFNLTLGREVLVPFDWFFAINEFNGASAGNCREEAILQGICEVVERHVSSIVSRGRKPVPGVDLATATDALAMEMLEKYKAAGIRLAASDFTLDTGIPTVGVLAYDPSTFPETSEIVWTAGTAPSPQKALSRALSEVAQLAGDFDTRSNYVASGLPKLSSVEEARYILSPGRSASLFQLPDLSDENMRIEIERSLSALAPAGLEVVVVETTHPLLGIPAFYTLIPGTHFRERAAGTSVGMFTAKLVAQNHPPALALEELKRMDKGLPGQYYIQFFLGICSQAVDAPEEAIRHFHRALEMNPGEEDIPSIYSYLAQGLKDLGRYQEALDFLGKAEAVDSERTDIFNLMGFCYYMLKEHEKAIASFQRVLALDPGSAIDYANIASNYRELGQLDKAVAFYRIALELDPSIDFARENLERLTEGKQDPG